MTSRTSRRSQLAPTVGAVAGAVVATLVLAGCSGGGTKDDSAEVAGRALASALTAGDVAKVPFTTTTAATQYAALAKPLNRLDPHVRSTAVTRKGDAATVTLSWETDGWKHETRASMRRTGTTWKVVWKPTVLESSLEPGETLVVTGIKAQRGDVLGGNGKPIVEPRPVIRFGIDKAVAAQKSPGADLAAAARRLAAVVHVSPAPLVKAVRTAGPQAFVPAIVMRTADVPDRLIGQIAAIPGARAIADQLPLAPSKDFASALLGTVGPVTAEIVKKSDGRLRAGDDAGLSGLQARYDEQLGGTSGIKISAVPATTAANEPTPTGRVLFQRAATPGKDLALSLDARLQTKAQQLLGRYGPASALVALRPSTGEVLVAASGPGSDGYNTATFGQYAPGSTFKIVSSLALLRAGVKPTTVVSCPATVSVDGKVFKNYSDYPSNRNGRIPLRQAVANSCNTAFISERSQVTGTALADAAAALGFGVDHDTGFPAYFGQVPAPKSETEAAADLIGQGKVLASPLAMATVVASVVHGSTVVPRLVGGVDVPRATPAKPLTAAEAASLRTLMRAVVTEGSGRFLASLPGGPVIAKTGTAEYGTAKGGGSLPTHTWMVGAQGDLAVAVFVADGESGSGTAGPVLEAFLRAAR
ncbi:MAG: penicillin-binding transpeptidase domain-containing protein [Marmoricola sp.]